MMDKYKEALIKEAIETIKEDFTRSDESAMSEMFKEMINNTSPIQTLEGYIEEDTLLELQKKHKKIVDNYNTIQCCGCDERVKTSEAKNGYGDELVCPKCHSWLVRHDEISITDLFKVGDEIDVKGVEDIYDFKGTVDGFGVYEDGSYYVNILNNTNDEFTIALEHFEN